MFIELFLLDNLLMDVLILRVACAFAARPFRLLRALLFALLGAVYAWGAVETAVLGAWPLRLLFAGLMALSLPNGGSLRAYLKALCAVLLAAFLVGGLAFAIACAGGAMGEGMLLTSVPLRAVLLIACTAALLPPFVRRRGVHGAVRLRLCARGNEYVLQACVDSGNLLCDPLSGRAVIVAYLPALAPYADIPIPAMSVHGSGMLYALRPEALYVDGVPVDALVALCEEPLESALLPAVLLQ